MISEFFLLDNAREWSEKMKLNSRREFLAITYHVHNFRPPALVTLFLRIISSSAGAIWACWLWFGDD